MGNPPCPPPPVSPPVTPPPAIPGQVSTAAGRAFGSLYVDGSTLVYIASNGTTFSGTGVSEGVVASAVPGSIYVENDDFKYVDENNVLRRLQRTSLGPKPAPAVSGSAWIDTSGRPTGRQLEWIGEASAGFWWNGF